MTDLTNERILLLDKLYNLRSEDSIITTKINDNITRLNDKISDTTNEKNSEIERKKNLENQLETFTTQSSLFLENFSAYDNSSFESLKEVDIDLKLGTLLAKLRQSVPSHKEEIKGYINESEGYISSYKSQIEELNNELTKSKIELEDAETVKEKLNNLLNDILLNHNDSYNRAFVKKVLDELNIFSEEEQTSLEYLILFPESGLAEYDSNYSNREHTNPFLEPEQTTTEITPEENIVEEDKIEEQEYVEEITEGDIVTDITNEQPLEETTYDIHELLKENSKESEPEPVVESTPEIAPTAPFAPIIEPIKEPEINLFFIQDDKEVTEDVKEVKEPYQDLKNNLEKLNIDYNKIKKEDYDNAMYLLSNTEYGVLALNYELLRSLEISEKIIYKYNATYNYMYLADPELSKKVSLIRSKGINDKIIKEELTSGNFTYSLSIMKDRIEALKTTGNDLTEKNISDIKADIIGFYKHILQLSDSGLELDDKEIRNYRYVLANSPYISRDSEVLKEHLVKLVQKNGKYALNVFWNNPKELELGIEALEEAGLASLIENNPEVLATNSDMIIRRKNYCQQHNMPINENNDETDFCDYIINHLAFYRSFENVDLPSIPNITENNKAISKLTGNVDYSNLLINILNKYYSEPENLLKIEFNDQDLENNYNNMVNMVGSILKATSETDRTYDIAGILLSKSKIARNIKVILNGLAKENQPIDGLEKEIILTSALYNLRVSKEQLEMVASNCETNKKLSKELGGAAA